MANSRTRRTVRHLTIRHLAIVASAAVMIFNTSAVQAQEGAFFKDLLGNMGIISKPSEDIEYRDRAPLVVPPQVKLRQPVDAQAVNSRNPAWPNDPDVEARRQAAANARKPAGVGSDNNDTKHGARLSIDEIRAGRRVGGGGEFPATPRPVYGDGGREEVWVNPNELRRMARPPAESVLAYGEEPTRRYLSDPPVGLRKPAANAPLPVASQRNTLPADNDTGQREFATTGRYKPPSSDDE
jgi:hypothetical protein